MHTLLLSLLLACASPREIALPSPAPVVQADALTRIDGSPMPAEVLAGKAVLYVNVASRCGYTPQYEGLQALWTEYRDRGLVIVGVPCNQFLGQEPGGAEEIQSFCKLNYGVDFPLLEKQEVNGKDRSALYRQLIGQGPDVKWNFEKFLVGRDGQVKARFASAVEPSDPALREAIEAALGG